MRTELSVPWRHAKAISPEDVASMVGCRMQVGDVWGTVDAARRAHSGRAILLEVELEDGVVPEEPSTEVDLSKFWPALHLAVSDPGATTPREGMYLVEWQMRALSPVLDAIVDEARAAGRREAGS